MAGCATGTSLLQLLPQRHCPRCQSAAINFSPDATPGRSTARRVLPRGLHAARAVPIWRTRTGRALGCCSILTAEVYKPSRLTASIWCALTQPHGCYTWGSALTHHCMYAGVPGGGLAPLTAEVWVAYRPDSFCRCACCQADATALYRRVVAPARAGFFWSGGWRMVPSLTGGWLRCIMRWVVTTGHAAPRRCWPTCLATRTGWLSPTAGLLRWIGGVSFKRAGARHKT